MSGIHENESQSPLSASPNPLKKYEIHISTIGCVSCTNVIEKMLQKVKGIQSFSADHLEKNITIVMDANVELSTVTKVLTDLSHQWHIRNETNSFNNKKENIDLSQVEIEKNNVSYTQYLYRAVAAGLPGVALFFLTLLNISLSPLIMMVVGIVTLPVMIYAGHDIYRDAYLAAKCGVITMDSLFAMSTSIAWIASFFALVLPGLGLPLFFEAGLLILGFRNLGRAIEIKSKEKVMKDLKLTARLPEFVEVHTSINKEISLSSSWLKPIDSVTEGELLRVKAGEMIPLDGDIVAGKASVDETILRGDFMPTSRTQGCVYAGMKVLEGELLIKVKGNSKDNMLTRIDKRIREGRQQKPEIQQLADKIVQYFVPGVLFLSLLSAILVSVFVNPTIALGTAISVLIISCPCVLGFTVALSMKIGVSKAAQLGTFFASGQGIERLQNIDTIVFDKTGTLTVGKPTIIGIHTHDQAWNKPEILSCMYALEKNLSHPTANAISEYCTDKITDPNIKCEGRNSDYGLGVTGIVNRHKMLIGNVRLLKAQGINVDAYQDQLAAVQSRGQFMIFVVADKKIIASVILEDQIKPEAKITIQQLRNMGKEIKMCTGSDKHSAIAIAAQLGIAAHDVYAEKMNKDKPDVIRALQQQGRRVAMVGDSVNDVEALTVSDVGIAVSSGDPVTQAQADILISHHSLQPLLNAFTIADQTMENVKQNLVITFIYNAVMIPIAGGGFLPLGITIIPAFAAAYMLIQLGLVLLNTYRFQHQDVIQQLGAKCEPVCTDTVESKYEFNFVSNPAKAVQATANYGVNNDATTVSVHEHLIEEKQSQYYSDEMLCQLRDSIHSSPGF